MRFCYTIESKTPSNIRHTIFHVLLRKKSTTIKLFDNAFKIIDVLFYTFIERAY